MDLILQDLTAVRRTWGRGVVFHTVNNLISRTPIKWDRANAIVLEHLGDTEGDIKINTNGEVAILTLPELHGPAGVEGDYTGENPVIEIPLYVTDPRMRSLISPQGSANAGNERRGRPALHTLVVFPEDLWLDPATNRINRLKNLTFSAGVWEWDGSPLTAEKTDLLGNTLWIWSGFFNRPPISFHGAAGDGKKQLETVSFQALIHGDMPDGSLLYTWGDPTDSAINLDGAS